MLGQLSLNSVPVHRTISYMPWRGCAAAPRRESEFGSICAVMPGVSPQFTFLNRSRFETIEPQARIVSIHELRRCPSIHPDFSVVSEPREQGTDLPVPDVGERKGLQAIDIGDQD